MSMTGPALSPEYLLDLYRITHDDLQRVREFGAIASPHIPQYVKLFYDWMEQLPEYATFFSDQRKLKRAQRLQSHYWELFFKAEIDDLYISNREQIGVVHASINLPLHTYLAAMSRSFVIITEELIPRQDDHEAKKASIHRLMNLDTAIVVNTFNERMNAIIREQSEALMEMATPIIKLWDNIIMLPIVGFIDSNRASDMMKKMLSTISSTQAKVAILDISGVAIVDTAVANYLMKITRATKLMGCETTISGISPSIAETIVDLGIDVGNVSTTANLRDALLQALHKTGAIDTLIRSKEWAQP